MSDDWNDPDEPNPLLEERRAIAAKQQQRGDEFVELHDPIEDDPGMRELLAQADALAEAELTEYRGTLGFCHMFWGKKQEILEDRFGVTWFSPDEMNPDICFD